MSSNWVEYVSMVMTMQRTLHLPIAKAAYLYTKTNQTAPLDPSMKNKNMKPSCHGEITVKN